jgi:hypothetical protein
MLINLVRTFRKTLHSLSLHFFSELGKTDKDSFGQRGKLVSFEACGTHSYRRALKDQVTDGCCNYCIN